jgi:anti-anti-sigma factor
VASEKAIGNPSAVACVAEGGCVLVFSVEPQEGDGRGFRLVGELDLATTSILIERLSPLAAEAGDLRLDLSELTFIDSSGIRSLLILSESLGTRGQLMLGSPAEPVLRTLELVGIEQAENIQISQAAP